MRMILFPIALLAALPATAQKAVTVGAEVATDEARRGLSWSEGHSVAAGDVTYGRGPVEVSARVVAIRDSVRHGGADAVADLQAGFVTRGPVQLRANVRGHVFVGAAGKMDFYEAGADASYTLGPVRAEAGAIYAPEQSAIGGSNLYLRAGASAGIPLTPFTVSAGVGRTSGTTNDPIRAARLRPVGNYSDWRVGIDYVFPLLTLGVDYVGTDIDQDTTVASPYADLRHSGNRLIARARLSF